MIHIAGCFLTPGEVVTWLFPHHLILSFNFANLIDEDSYSIILLYMTLISSKIILWFIIFKRVNDNISYVYLTDLFKLWLIFFY